MKLFKSILFIVFMMAFVLLAESAFAKSKVVVVSGVGEEEAKTVGSYSLIISGIESGFSGKNVELIYQWIALDSKATDAEKTQLGQSAIANAKKEKPDVIIVLNDNCLKYVGLKIDDIPVVFAWVFARTNTIDGLPKANVTGVVRRSYAADIWSLAKQLLGVETVALMSKNSLSMQGVRKYLAAGADKLKAASGVTYKEMYLFDTFEDWKARVLNFEEDFVYLADTSRIKDGDRILERKELTAWTVANCKKPVIAATEADTEGGALFAIVTSEKAIGTMAASQTIKILDGAKAGDVKYATSKKGKLVVNMKTADKYKLKIPYEILSSAERVIE